MSLKCPCHSGKAYAECCKPYHEGKLPENALALMRSRYAAYALHLADYIIQTTHPHNPAYTADKQRWKQEILAFSNATAFIGLTIHEFIDGPKEAYVTFTAFLKQQNQSANRTEKSRFIKVNDRWLYESGQMS